MPKKLTKRQKLEGAVRACIKDYTFGHLTFQEVDILAETYTHFVVSAVTKYERGRQEHGGSLFSSKRDMHLELENELIDAVHYLAKIKLDLAKT